METTKKGVNAIIIIATSHPYTSQEQFTFSDNILMIPGACATHWETIHREA